MRTRNETYRNQIMSDRILRSPKMYWLKKSEDEYAGENVEISSDIGPRKTRKTSFQNPTSQMPKSNSNVIILTFESIAKLALRTSDNTLRSVLALVENLN